MIHFIADIGSNFNQDMDRAKELIRQSKQAGFYGVKFQLFKPDRLYKDPDEKLLNDLTRRALPPEWVPALKDYAHSFDLKFGCTPFDNENLMSLAGHVDFIKISSYDVLRDDLIDNACKICRHIIISTGLCTFDEIDDMIERVLGKYPDNKIELLHCVSKYPCSIEEMGMKRFAELLLRFGIGRYMVGYSDHTADESAIYSMAYGLIDRGTIEVHVDLDDRAGWETSEGHCWHFDKIKNVIGNISNFDRIMHSDFSQDLSIRASREDGLRR